MTLLARRIYPELLLEHACNADRSTESSLIPREIPSATGRSGTMRKAGDGKRSSRLLPHSPESAGRMTRSRLFLRQRPLRERSFIFKAASGGAFRCMSARRIRRIWEPRSAVRWESCEAAAGFRIRETRSPIAPAAVPKRSVQSGCRGIAPAFPADTGRIVTSRERLTDRWHFEKETTWYRPLWGRTIPQSAPAVTARTWSCRT